MKIPLIASHQAGHVAARFLTAKLMGHNPADAVDFVDRGSITSGPMFSKAIEAAWAAFVVRFGLDPARAARVVNDDTRIVLQVARNAGANIDRGLSQAIRIASSGLASPHRTILPTAWCRVSAEPAR